jgi:hypothetical protein
MVMVSFIFLNLFIAIILESFNTRKDEDRLQVGEETIRKFKSIWLQFDPKGRGFIPVQRFPKLVKMIVVEEVKEVYERRHSIFQTKLLA